MRFYRVWGVFGFRGLGFIGLGISGFRFYRVWGLGVEGLGSYEFLTVLLLLALVGLVATCTCKKYHRRLFAKHSAVGFEFRALGFRGHECCMLTSFSPQTDGVK